MIHVIFFAFKEALISSAEQGSIEFYSLGVNSVLEFVKYFVSSLLVE